MRVEVRQSKKKGREKKEEQTTVSSAMQTSTVQNRWQVHKSCVREVGQAQSTQFSWLLHANLAAQNTPV